MPHNADVDFNDEKFVKKYLREISKPERPTKSKGPLRHENFDFTVIHTEDMSVHLIGDKPVRLLDDYRPNEPKDVYNYRLKIYEPFTLSSAQKIINTICKIRNNSNFAINFPKDVPIPDPEDTLENYTENNYPVYGSLLKWIFNVVLECDLNDPNALVCFIPFRPTEDPTAFFEPIGKIFRSDQVIDYSLDDYYTILLDEKSRIKKNNITTDDGLIYLVFTRNEVIEFKQTAVENGVKKFDQIQLFEHNFDETPVFFLGGTYMQKTFPPVFKSFISGVLPFWNAAIRQQSDLDAQFVQHMYLERVEIEVECDAIGCQFQESEGFHGITREGECKICQRCNGSGFIQGRSPYGVTKVKKEELGENPQIFPGIVYPIKPIEIVQTSIDYIKSLVTRGFASVNMEFAEQIPLNQSGKAKEHDKEDGNNFILKISDNLFDNIIFNSYRLVNLWRYFQLFNEDKNKLKENMPIINKPTNVDVTTINTMNQEMASLKEAGVSDETLSLLEKDMIDKRFANDKFSRTFLQAVIELDPMPNKREDDKMVILANKGVNQIDYIISSNMKPFLLMAIEEDEEFLSKPRKEKMEVLTKFAEEKVKEATPIKITNQDGSTEGNT